MALIEKIPINRKKSYYPFIRIAICILLFLATIQIIPNDSKIINNASASSTWEDYNWSAPENYSSLKSIDIMPNSGDLKLHYGRALYVADFSNSRIVKTTMDGSFWTTVGTSGTGIGQFNYPGGILCDSTGYIYVTDTNNNRIVKTMMNGSGWTTYGAKGNNTGQFNMPYGINYDCSIGYIYVTDTFNHRIVKTMMNGSGWITYGSNGNGMGQFNRPAGIDYDSSTGNLYVADMFNNRIVKTKIDGSGWTTLGTVGTGINQFSYPVSISYDNSTGFIYVADSYNHRIVKTKMNGSGWTTYGIKGSGTGQFNTPYGIDYDSTTEYSYIVDGMNDRIVKTMMNGSGWTTYGTKGSGTGQFDLPHGITLSESSYFSDGYLISKKYNFGSPADLLTLSWVADTPQDTNVKFQLRSAPNQSALVNKNFVGPNGSTNTYYNKTNKTGINIWNGHNGDIWAQYKVYLNTSNLLRTPVLKNVKIVYNLLPNQPTLISPPDNTWTNDNTTTFSWQQNDTDSSAQNAFQWQADNDKEFNHIDYDSNIITSLQSSYTLTASLPDGFWYWRVRTKDNDGGWGPFSLPWKILIDTKPPTSNVTIPENNSFYNNLDIITGIAFNPEASASINKVELSIKRLGDNDEKYWNGSGWASGISWLLASGTSQWEYNSSSVIWTSGFQYHVQSRAIDNATNIEIPGEGVVFTFDIEKPRSTIITPQNNSFLNRLEMISGISSDFALSGVKEVEILIKQTSDDNYWTGDSWSPNETSLKAFGTNDWEFDSSLVEWTSGNQYIIYARATDNVNNVEVTNAWTGFVFDTDKPVLNIIHPTAGSFLNHLELITGNASDHGDAGLERIEITIKRNFNQKYWDGISWQDDTKWLVAQGTNDWTYDTSKFQWITDTYYTIRSRAIDMAGNDLISWNGTTFMYDNKPPEQSLVINNNTEFTNSETVELSLEYADSGSGVSLMAFSNDDVEWSSWEPINATKTFNLSHGDGEKVVYFRVQDRAGNIAEPAHSSIIFDSQPPECSILINDDAEFTNSNLVSLSLTASDSLSGVSLMAFSFDSNTWTNWKPFNSFDSIILSNQDGDHTVYFRVQDLAGNTAIASDTIALDTTAPHSLLIVINNGATETKSTSVSLKLKALDDTSGVDQMSFSADGITWSPWEDYVETRSYDLPPDSDRKVIYFRVKDKAGNVAHPEVGLITLNNPRSETESESTDMLWLFILFIIIVIVIAISIAVVVSRRKKRAKEQVPSQEAIIIESGDLSATTISTPHLVPAQEPTQPQLQATTTPVPQIAQVQPLPQLPPAQSIIPQTTVQPTQIAPTTTTQPVPQIQPTPTVQQPQPQTQVQPTPQPTLKPSLSGPVVHLPDDPQLATDNISSPDQPQPAHAITTAPSTNPTQPQIQDQIKKKTID